MKSFIQISKDEKLLLWLLLVVGFALRVAGITWGIPVLDPLEGFYHPDESKIIRGAFLFPAHIYANTDLRYPTFLHYFIGIATYPLRTFDSAHLYTDIFVAGRIISAFFGTATIVLTFLLGRKLFSSNHGSVAALLFTVAMFPVQNAAWATTDTAVTFLSTLFLLTWLDSLERNSNWKFALSGIIFGLSIGTKYTAVLLIVPAIALMISDSISLHFPKQDQIKRFINSEMLLFYLFSLVFFLLTTPGIIFHFDAFLDSLTYEAHRASELKASFFLLSTWEVIVTAFRDCLGSAAAWLALIGMVFPLKTTRKVWILRAFVVFYALFFGAALYPRYLILISPILSVLAASLIVYLFELTNRHFKIFAAGLLTLVILSATTQTLRAINLRFNDPRTAASHLLHQMIPKKCTISRIYASDTKQPRWAFPVMNNYRFSLVDRDQNADIVVVSANKRIDQKIRKSIPEIQKGYLPFYEFHRETPVPVEFAPISLLLFVKEASKDKCLNSPEGAPEVP